MNKRVINRAFPDEPGNTSGDARILYLKKNVRSTADHIGKSAFSAVIYCFGCMVMAVSYCNCVSKGSDRKEKTMRKIPVTVARKNIYQVLMDVNETPEPILLTNRREKKNAVIISEEMWEEIQEKLGA